MKSIGTLGLTILTTTAIALMGPSSATAESTALCIADEGKCSFGHLVASLHEVSVGKVKILTSFFTVECAALYSGTIFGLAEPGPQEITGSFTYTACEASGGSCTVENPGLGYDYLVLRSGHETAEVSGMSGPGVIHVKCGSSMDCEFESTQLKGTAKGPLLSSQKNGEIVFSEQTLEKIPLGFLCPKVAKLDMVITPLLATYIAS